MNVTLEQFASALADAKIRILKFQPDNQRPVSVEGRKSSITLHDFAVMFREHLAEYVEKHLAVFKLTKDTDAFKQAVADYMASLKPAYESGLPERYQDLTLNQDPTRKREDAFYLTTPNERLSAVDAQFWIDANYMKLPEARAAARTAVRRYRPRDPLGVTNLVLQDGQAHDVFNTYVPPTYLDYVGDLPDELPELVSKLVNHLFPLEIERRYFWHWLRESLTGRTGVYLILCGAAGTGKNRLKILMRALHGHMNTVDLKEATLERFNSQVFDCTLLWLDETKIHERHESILKEMQNDTVAEERKGVDTSRATAVWFNAVMSNNNFDSNHIVFEGRKFVPLVVTVDRLEKSMSSEEIDLFSRKLEKVESPEFDERFVAQTYRWVMKHGRPRGKPPYTNLEYRGPMFYRLAHASMREWQRRSVDFLIREVEAKGSRIEKSDNGYRWSSVQAQISRKHKGRVVEPGYAKVMEFMKVFADSSGRLVFKVTPVEGDLMGDFWVKQIVRDVKILTRLDVQNEKPELIKPVAKQPRIETQDAERTPTEKEKVVSRSANGRRDARARPLVRRGRPTGRRSSEELLAARRKRIAAVKKT